MKQKLLDFLSSYGLMIIGCLLIFIASASLKTNHYPLLKFPESAPITAPAQAREGGDITPKELPMSRPVVPLPKDKTEFTDNLTAVSVYAVDDFTDTVLYAKNSLAVRPLASITKLVSMLTLADLPMQWNSTTTIQGSDCDSSSHQVEVGEEYTLDDLWNVALVASSNGAVKALVRASGILPENFVILMNRKAQELGLTSATFAEPTGLDSANAASAEDTARLLREALKYEKIRQAAGTAEYYAQPLNEAKAKRMWSTNWLLTNWIPNKFDKENIAGKTGYIIDSGYNFAVYLEDEKKHAIRIVVLGADSNESRFSEARDLAEWIFGHYLWPDDEGYDELAE
ncbi:MAG: serine hydrolase [Candidatus Paceibacterota bacterium]